MENGKKKKVTVNGEELYLKGGFYPNPDFMGVERHTPALWLEDEDGEFWADVTKGFGEFIGLCGITYIDGNSLFDIAEFMEREKIGFKTDYAKQSGFCIYPGYVINPEILEELCDEDELKAYMLDYDFYGKGFVYEEEIKQYKRCFAEVWDKRHGK